MVDKTTIAVDNVTVDLIKDIRKRDKLADPSLRVRGELTSGRIVHKALLREKADK